MSVICSPEIRNKKQAMGNARQALVDPAPEIPLDRPAESEAEGTGDKTQTVERLTAHTDGAKGGAKLAEIRRLLVKALKAYKRQDFGAAALRALEATRLDETCAQAYHVLAIALEGMGELHKALQMYERALKLDPEDAEIYLNLGLVAWKLRMLEGAEKFFGIYISMQPAAHQGYNNLGSVLRDQHRFDEAIDVIRNAIYRFPENAELWNTMGTIAMEQGSVTEARLFYEEALRLAPGLGRTYHNVAYAISHTGPLEDALAYYDKALKLMGKHPDAIEARHGRGQVLLGLGRLEEGWADWEIRHDRRFRGSFIYAINAPRWEGEDLHGKRLLVMGEQGLGDEILFACGYRDLIERLGADGKLVITADSRLTSLLQRSFPEAELQHYANRRHNAKGVRICPWLNEETKVDYFSTNGSTMRFLRPTIESFETGRPLLVPDPARVAYWRSKVEALGSGLYTGFCWRSMVMTGTRKKYFASLDDWAPVLKQPGAVFVNLQYGDCKDELAYFAERHGITVHNFPEIDLKDELDELAALAHALDLVISAPTASGAIAAATGTEAWFPMIGYSWTQLGTDHFPFYPKNRVFSPDRYGNWPEVMQKIAAALEDFKAAGRPNLAAVP
jgi:tetratricopeptide (TPR) repeat protein